MKKLLLLTTLIPTLLLASCSSFKPIQEKYVDIIHEKFDADNWCYTYKKAQPESKDAYIIEFYVFEPSFTYSIWLCTKENNELKCELVLIHHS